MPPNSANSIAAPSTCSSIEEASAARPSYYMKVEPDRVLHCRSCRALHEVLTELQVQLAGPLTVLLGTDGEPPAALREELDRELQMLAARNAPPRGSGWSPLALLQETIGIVVRAATIHRNVGALRGLIKYALGAELMERDPFLHVQLPEKGETERVRLTTAELNQLVEAAGAKRGRGGQLRVRDPRFTVMVRALLLTHFALAIRISELLKLTPEDLNFDQKVIRLRLAKGAKTREVPMGERTEAALREWLQVRRLLLATREGDRRVRGTEPPALWLADRGRPLSREGVSALLDDVCAGGGIEKTVRIHDLRALTAQSWKRAGVPAEVISAWLGHADVAQTKRYLKDACADTRQYAHFCDLPELGEAQRSTSVLPLLPTAPAVPEPLVPGPVISGTAPVSATAPVFSAAPSPSSPAPAAAAEPAAPANMLEMFQAFQELQRLHQRFPLLQQLMGTAAPLPAGAS